MKEHTNKYGYAFYSYNLLKGCAQFRTTEYNEAIEEFFRVTSVQEIFGSWKILSSKTIERLEKFELEWRNYIRITPYGLDGVFVNLDENWRSIVEHHLLPAIQSIENDFDQSKMEYDRFKKNEDVSIKCNPEDILKRVGRLYTLLNKNDNSRK